jgi:hypothetical protein
LLSHPQHFAVTSQVCNALDEMPANEFRSELRDTLTAFYENFLLRAGAGGRPVAKELIRKFKVKAAPVPDAAALEAGAAAAAPAAAAVD